MCHPVSDTSLEIVWRTHGKDIFSPNEKRGAHEGTYTLSHLPGCLLASCLGTQQQEDVMPGAVTAILCP